MQVTIPANTKTNDIYIIKYVNGGLASTKGFTSFDDAKLHIQKTGLSTIGHLHISRCIIRSIVNKPKNL